MTESPEPRTEPTAVETRPPVYRDVPPERVYQPHSRLNAVLAWVGIVAGVVFIVAVIFFSGFAIGRHSGGGNGGWQHHHWQGAGMSHHQGRPPMAQWRFPGGGPGGQWGGHGGPGQWGGPGGQGGGPGQWGGSGGQGGAGGQGGGPGGQQSPTTSPSPARP